MEDWPHGGIAPNPSSSVPAMVPPVLRGRAPEYFAGKQPVSGISYERPLPGKLGIKTKAFSAEVRRVSGYWPNPGCPHGRRTQMAEWIPVSW